MKQQKKEFQEWPREKSEGCDGEWTEFSKNWWMQQEKYVENRKENGIRKG